MKDIKRRIKKGERVFGSWLQLPDADIAEIYEQIGFDFLSIDMEHSEIQFSDAAGMMRGMKQTAPFIRVSCNDPLEIRKSLDIGAMGVIVPLIHSRADALKAVAAAKYPPEGIRGFAFCRDNAWGMEFDECAKTANEQTMVFVMIESREAVEQIDEIVSVEGVDGVFIGPYDMSGSYGVLGQASHPVMLEAENKILQSCKKYGKAAGIHVVTLDREKIKESIQKGFTFIAIGIDAEFLYEGAKNMLDIAHKEAIK